MSKQEIMPEPSDIRNETCTNLSILINLLIRRIQPGDCVSLVVTRKQLIHIEEILTERGIVIRQQPLPEDLLITLSKPDAP